MIDDAADTIAAALAATPPSPEQIKVAEQRGFKEAIKKISPGWRDMMVAFQMIEDAIEELAPVGALKQRDQGLPPAPIEDAERIITAIQRLAEPPPEREALRIAREGLTAIIRAHERRYSVLDEAGTAANYLARIDAALEETKDADRT